MKIYYIMKIEILIIGITLFLAIDTYYDGKYSSYLSSGRKYFKIGTIKSIYRIISNNFYKKTS